MSVHTEIHAPISSSPFRNFMKRVWNGIIESRQKSATRIMLQSLSERELRDIGITRGMIEGIADGPTDSPYKS